jgi:hypothetical protein
MQEKGKWRAGVGAFSEPIGGFSPKEKGVRALGTRTARAAIQET